MRPSRTLVTLATAAAAMRFYSPAAAHPHDIVTVMVSPMFDADGRFAAVGEVWTFGYDVTDIAKPQLDDNRVAVIDQRELDTAMDFVLAWIPEADYFTRITLVGKQVAHANPTGVSANWTLAN